MKFQLLASYYWFSAQDDVATPSAMARDDGVLIYTIKHIQVQYQCTICYVFMEKLRFLLKKVQSGLIAVA